MGPKAWGPLFKNTKLRAELNISLEWKRKSQHISRDFSLFFWDLFRQFTRNANTEMLSDYNLFPPPPSQPPHPTSPCDFPAHRDPCKWGPWSLSFICFIVSPPPLCDLGQVTELLWSSVCSSTKWNHNSYLRRLLWGPKKIMQKSVLEPVGTTQSGYYSSNANDWEVGAMYGTTCTVPHRDQFPSSYIDYCHFSTIYACLPYVTFNGFLDQ